MVPNLLTEKIYVFDRILLFTKHDTKFNIRNRCIWSILQQFTNPLKNLNGKYAQFTAYCSISKLKIETKTKLKKPNDVKICKDLEIFSDIVFFNLFFYSILIKFKYSFNGRIINNIKKMHQRWLFSIYIISKWLRKNITIILPKIILSRLKSNNLYRWEMYRIYNIYLLKLMQPKKIF